MSTCWAACLGNCSGKMSHEHLITQAIFLDNEMTVSGFPWCAEPKKVGLPSLTAKILCAAHNSALSEVDEEALRFVQAIRESFKLSEIRLGLKPRRWRFVRFPIEGYLLERWLLKTLINVSYDRDLLIGPGSPGVGEPSTSLVEIAFGKKMFESGAGLYGIHDAVENRPREDGITICSINRPANRIVAAVFSFIGFRLLLFLDPKGPMLPFWGITTATSGKPDVIEPCYHLKRIGFGAGKGVSHAIEFKWARSRS